MKALLITLVVVILAVWAIVKFGGVTGFDPQAQAEAFKEKAVVGTDWKVLADEMRPTAYRSYREDDDMGMAPSIEIKFDRERFEKSFDEGMFKNGFILEYTLTASDVYSLYFDGDGKLEAVNEPITMQDLLDGSAVQKMQEQ